MFWKKRAETHFERMSQRIFGRRRAEAGAVRLGMKRSTLQLRMRRLGISRESRVLILILGSAESSVGAS